MRFRGDSEIIAKRNPQRRPTHPGALLPETAIADAPGISRQHLYDMLRERKPLCAEVAVRLGAAVGDGPEARLLQAAHDAWPASGKVDLGRVPRLAAWPPSIGATLVSRRSRGHPLAPPEGRSALCIACAANRRAPGRRSGLCPRAERCRACRRERADESGPRRDLGRMREGNRRDDQCGAGQGSQNGQGDDDEGAKGVHGGSPVRCQENTPER